MSQFFIRILMGILSWVLARAQERSTWFGIVSLLSSAGMAISPELQAAAAQLGLAFSGVLLIWTKEHQWSAKPDSSGSG